MTAKFIEIFIKITVLDQNRFFMGCTCCQTAVKVKAIFGCTPKDLRLFMSNLSSAIKVLEMKNNRLYYF